MTSIKNIKTSFRISLVALCAFLFAIPSSAQELLWSEEFNDGVAPDPNHWSYDLGATGWGNQELQEYTDDLDNVRIENGELIITAMETEEGTSPAAFSSGRLRTEDKVEFMYGTIEARISRAGPCQGGYGRPSGTLGGNFSEVGWPFCGELDVFEMGWRDAVNDGVVNRWLSSAAHWESGGQYAFFAGLTLATSLNPVPW